MAWKCPQCRQTNENELKKCACGYAFYEVLGLKADAPEQSVEQTYKYLIKVWKTPTEAQDTHSRSRLDERVHKINDAYAVFRQISKKTDSSIKNPQVIKIAIGAGVAFVVVIAAIFLFLSSEKVVQQTGAPVSSPVQMAAPEQSTAPQPLQSASVQPAMQQQSPERRTDTPDMTADKTPNWAIESVKASYVLDRSATVDTLVNKWTTENADKLKAIGWIARKADDKTYLVTYTATDGVTPRGFYFELNIETGDIRSIAGNAELQQKYGIKGN